MKFLMTMMMTLALTSAFAGEECKKDGACKVAADCKKFGGDYGIVNENCINLKASEKETQCPGIVNTSGAKGSSADSAATKDEGSGLKR